MNSSWGDGFILIGLQRVSVVVGQAGKDIGVLLPGMFFLEKALDESGNHDGLHWQKQVGMT